MILELLWGGNPKQKQSVSLAVGKPLFPSHLGPFHLLHIPQISTMTQKKEDYMLRREGKGCILLSFGSQEVLLGKPVKAVKNLSCSIYCGLQKLQLFGFFSSEEKSSHMEVIMPGQTQSKRTLSFPLSTPPFPTQKN